jgi:hypothetical protein
MSSSETKLAARRRAYGRGHRVLSLAPRPLQPAHGRGRAGAGAEPGFLLVGGVDNAFV